MAEFLKRTVTSITRAVIVLSLGAVLLAGGCSAPKGATIAERKANARQMRDTTLRELYEKRPEAVEKIARAAGYGVFSDWNVNLILLSTGNGWGVVVDKKTGKETFMNMAQLGIGLGLGAKDFRAVFIFRSEEALRKFIHSGWEFGGHADAAAVAGEKGGQASAAGTFQDIEIYQFTKNGLALQATIAGTKYWRDKELNEQPQKPSATDRAELAELE